VSLLEYPREIEEADLGQSTFTEQFKRIILRQNREKQSSFCLIKAFRRNGKVQ
jgi:hypothetical protein